MNNRAGKAEMSIMTAIRILTTLTLFKMVAFWISMAKEDARGLEDQDSGDPSFNQLEE